MNSKENQQAQKYTLGVIFTTLIARLIIAANTGLVTGEAYYYRGAKDLALSYFDQPPMFFWLSGLSIRLFGESTLALRLPAIILFAFTSWLLFLLAKRFYNVMAGFYAVLLINLSAVFTISVATWFQPDAPLMCFWLLCTYCVTKVLFPEHSNDTYSLRNSTYTWKWWILTGITLGLTILSKYHVVFLVAGILIFVLSRKEHRHWITHPGPYLAIILGLSIAWPLFYWNYQHNWISFTFQSSRAGSGDFSLHFDWFFRSLGGQALWLLPWIWLPLIYQLYRTWKVRQTDLYSWFCFCTAILPIVFFTVITLWKDMQFHFHWQAPGYMMLFIPLGQAVNIAREQGAKTWRRYKRWLIASTAFTIIAISALAGHTATGFWTAYGPEWLAKQFGKKYDPTIKGIDYDNIRNRFKQEEWLANKNLFVGTTRWWLSGKTDWALRGKKPVLIFHEDPRNYAYFFDPGKMLGKDAIIIGKNSERTVRRDARPFFDTIKPLPQIWITRAGKQEMPLNVYKAENFQVPGSKPEKQLPVYRMLKGKDPF